MRKRSLFVFLCLVIGLAMSPPAFGDSHMIKIGFNIPLTGDNPDVGASSKNAAEMYLKSTPKVQAGDKTYELKFIYEDNEYKPESAVKINTKLITEEGVLGIIGPQSSSQAVPAGEVANNNATPMISPWSTNPNTTLDRPYVFRGCFLDPFQGPVAANFATDELGAKKAAVIYDIADLFPSTFAQLPYTGGSSEAYKCYGFQCRYLALSHREVTDHYPESHRSVFAAFRTQKA